MYLVVRPKHQADELIARLDASRIKAQWLPVVDTVINPDQLARALVVLPDYQLIMLTSPAAIDYLFAENPKLNLAKHILVVPGEATAQRLAKIYPGQIIYPTHGSGIAAVAECQLLEKYRRWPLLIIGGNNINPKLTTYLTQLDFQYQYLSLYQVVDYSYRNANLLEKTLSDNSIVGIIITSKQIAGYMIECAKRLNLTIKLQQLQLISIHQQITEFLLSKGFVKVAQTLSSNSYSIVNLIRELEYERAAK